MGPTCSGLSPSILAEKQFLGVLKLKVKLQCVPEKRISAFILDWFYTNAGPLVNAVVCVVGEQKQFQISFMITLMEVL